MIVKQISISWRDGRTYGTRHAKYVVAVILIVATFNEPEKTKRYMKIYTFKSWKQNLYKM